MKYRVVKIMVDGKEWFKPQREMGADEEKGFWKDFDNPDDLYPNPLLCGTRQVAIEYIEAVKKEKLIYAQRRKIDGEVVFKTEF